MELFTFIVWNDCAPNSAFILGTSDQRLEYFRKHWVSNRVRISDCVHDEEHSFKTVSYFLHFMVDNLGVYSCFDIKTVLILDYSDSHRASDVLDSLDNWNSSQGNDSKKKFELRESFKHTDWVDKHSYQQTSSLPHFKFHKEWEETCWWVWRCHFTFHWHGWIHRFQQKCAGSKRGRLTFIKAIFEVWPSMWGIEGV